MTSDATKTVREFVLPDLGEGVHEGQVLRLLVAEGERVAEDQLLMEVETDKAAVEIPSPYAGVIARLHVGENEVVNVGDLMITFGDGDGSAPVAAAPAAKAPPAKQSIASAPATVPVIDTIGAPPRRRPASPAVRRLARERGIDLEQVQGTGPGGRILRGDVERALDAPSAAHAVASAPAPARGIVPPPPPPAPLGVFPAGKDATDQCGPVRRVALTKTRRRIAEVMCRAATTIPHVTDTDDADVTDLDALRRDYNGDRPREERIGLLSFVIRAVVRALRDHPIFNAALDIESGTIVYKRYYNVAVGVQTERGLVAPVLRQADRMTVPEIDAALAALIERARCGSLGLEETTGATYTISNAGAMGGSRYSTPIITLPQVAVLAVGRSRKMPWVVDDAVVPRLIMPLSHSMDHRIIDGAEEIAFFRQVIGDLEHPARLLLENVRGA